MANDQGFYDYTSQQHLADVATLLETLSYHLEHATLLLSSYSTYFFSESFSSSSSFPRLLKAGCPKAQTLILYFP